MPGQEGAGQHAGSCHQHQQPSTECTARTTGWLDSSWQIVRQFRNILLAAQRELPAERIRGVHDPILRRVQSLIGRGQRAGTFRRDLPKQWLITTTFSLMHAAAEDAAAGRIQADAAAGLITATLLAAFTPPTEDRKTPD
jgi:hypothetical protein